ncbi:hypothetical protein C2U37_14965 [Aeromonas sp. ASNIH1]|nr:hypothetical protein C2U37_14965 [Aeromonas sp. ASNIH1]
MHVYVISSLEIVQLLLRSSLDSLTMMTMMSVNWLSAVLSFNLTLSVNYQIILMLYRGLP